MQDMEFTLDSGESAKIRVWQDKEPFDIFVWQENASRASVSISSDDGELFCVEIAGKEIRVIRNTPNTAFTGQRHTSPGENNPE